MKIPYNNIEFVSLTSDIDLSFFDCGDPEINDFIQNDAKGYQEDLLAKTYLAYHEGQPVGFFSLATGCIAADAVEQLGERRGYRPRKYPAVKIAQMATCKSYQGRDIGKNMLKVAFGIALSLCRLVGCRVVVVDSKKDEKTVNFYKKYGEFIPFGTGSEGETIPLMRDIKKVLTDGEGITHISDYIED